MSKTEKLRIREMREQLQRVATLLIDEGYYVFAQKVLKVDYYLLKLEK